MSIHWATIADRAVVFLATAAAGFSAWTGFQVRRAADATARATEAQAKSTADAARATAEAARAAEASARSAEAAQAIAERLTQIEIDRRHDEMAPDLDVRFEWEENTRLRRSNLFAYVTNRSPRDYATEARLVLGQGGTSNAGTPRFGAGQTIKIDVGDEVGRLPIGLEIDFDAVDPCPCPRTTASGRHWPRSFNVPQDKPDASR